MFISICRMVENMDELTHLKHEWLKECRQDAKGQEYSRKTFSGIPVSPLYTPDDIQDGGYMKSLGFPGQPPYTRGVYADMYWGRPWTMRQLAGFGTPEETNERIRFLLRQGATGINITFDYPTLRGYDSDDPVAEADAGLGGVAVDHLS
ncbi:MAG: methylmalonyl-CoA mutase family protein, partial [Dehalococcoidia bacterium]|nr:methylmalonyl-CoA mutase family protein [Dehalococcoidia bacterium]